MQYLAKINSHAARLALTAFLFVAVSATSVFSGNDHNSDTIIGIWRTESTSEITIKPCDTGYCGYVTKVVVPDRIKRQYGADVAKMAGNIIDGLNKNPKLRARPLQGLQVLSLNGDISSNQLKGQIYNPEDGQTYNGFMQIVGSNKLRLSGCVLFNLICRGEDWTRVTRVSAL